jgi:hypothetical protein
VRFERQSLIKKQKFRIDSPEKKEGFDRWSLEAASTIKQNSALAQDNLFLSPQNAINRK